jgi:hypothetical protein
MTFLFLDQPGFLLAAAVLFTVFGNYIFTGPYNCRQPSGTNINAIFL